MDPSTGRFTTMDSYLGRIQDPTSLHKYLYAHSNPVNYTDPSGYFTLGGMMIGLDIQLSLPSIAMGGIAALFGVLGTTLIGECIHELSIYIMLNDIDMSTLSDEFIEAIENVVFSKEDKSDSPSSLQKEVEKGRAPKDVERVDKPHVEGQKPHVHFKDKTSLNNDGTIHDKHRGTPNVTNKVRKWLEKHGWRVND